MPVVDWFTEPMQYQVSIVAGASGSSVRFPRSRIDNRAAARDRKTETDCLRRTACASDELRQRRTLLRSQRLGSGTNREKRRKSRCAG